MKKILSLFLSVIMLLGITIPAFASYETPFEDSMFYEYEGYSIHYRVFTAQEEKGKIFMIHGFALSSYCWVELATRLVREGYTCVMADLPDFGYSERETADTKKLPREEIMHALMKELSNDKWYVAGHSMGGYIAQAIAEKYPEDVKNLLLYGTAGNDNSKALTSIMGNNVFVALMGPLMQLMTRFDALVKMFLRMGLNDKAYADNYDIAKVTEPLRIEGTGKGACYSFSMLPNTNYEAIKNGKPVLFVNGSKDSVIPDKSKDKLRGYLPQGSMDVIISDGGHMFIENMAEETARATLEFLANNP